MKNEIRTPTKTLVKNSILNLLGMIIPIFIGLFAIPITIKGLGKEGFGILSIAWVSIGYLILLDFGLARSTTKYIADSLHRGDRDGTVTYFNISILLALVFGSMGGFAFLLFVPKLVNQILNIPTPYQLQTINSLKLIAISLPFLLISIITKGCLGAAQRFDLVNYVHVPTSIIYFILPTFSYFFNFSIFQVVLGILISRIIAMTAYFLFCIKLLKIKWHITKVHKEKIFNIMSFGGWVTVTAVLSPLLVYIDRFFIGSLLTMSALAFYSAPMEALSRLRIFPNSIMLTMFPEFSKKSDYYTNEHIQLLFGRAFKIIMIISMGTGILLFGAAKDILFVWLGSDYVVNSLAIFKVISIGIIFNFIALLPFTFLQGIGRPDIPAKFHFIELPIYLVFLLFGIKHFGLLGAALAWTLRVVFDCMLLYISVNRHIDNLMRLLINNYLVRIVIIFVNFFILLLIVSLLTGNILIRMLLFLLSFILLSTLLWFSVLNHNERKTILSLVRIAG
jgi:O-antigen/teichoic acid export membrane protein